MSVYRKMLVTIGILVCIVAVLGIPYSWKQPILVFFGAATIFLAVVKRRRAPQPEESNVLGNDMNPQ